MATTLTFGRKRPVTGDPGSTWFVALEDNITLDDAHDHDGTDSAQLTNTGISASAAIARSKLASGTAYRILANTSAGVMSENAALTATHVVYADANGQLAGEASLAISRGGTGQATANAGFNALAPTTTKGDLIAYSTVNARLAVGSDNQVLTADSAQALGVKWATPSAEKDQSYEITNHSIACSVAANALTIALKTKAGTDPTASDVVGIGFRNVTSATGTYLRRTVTGSLSLVISSGSTLGHKDATESFIYVYALDNAGTVELAASSTYYDEGKVRTTTTEGGLGAADSISGIYSTTGRTSKPIRCIGRLRSTQTTAGTWAAVPTEISLAPFIWKEVTPWTTALTITPSSSAFGTISGNDYRTRRVGDSLEVVGFFVMGTRAANPAKIAIPTNLTIDTNKCFGTKKTLVGTFFTSDDATSNGLTIGTGVHSGGAMYIETGDTSNVYMTTTGNGGTFESANGDTIGANTDSIFYRFTIPITEWAE